jgi:arylformamidase
VATLTLGVHTGTHVDAPYHLLEEGARIGSLALGIFIGPAILVDVNAHEVIDAAMCARILGSGPFPERVLFCTGAWRRASAFPTSYPALDSGAADLLRGSGVKLVGTDAPSVDPFNSADLPVHRILLTAGIPIIENLILDDVPEGSYELIALPLRLSDADASPIRAVLRTR